MGELVIGIAQIKQTNDIGANGEKALEYVDRAAKSGVQILCFPEAHLPGYRVDITPADAPVQVDQLAAWEATIAKRCGKHDVACILGTETHIPNEKPRNTALIISEQGKMIGRHDKTVLTPLDALAYSPGSGFSVWPLRGVPVGVVICFEGFRFADTTRACVLSGAKVLFHLQNNTTRPGTEWKLPVHEAMLVTRAAENTTYLVSANIACEFQNCRSLVVAPDGQIRAASKLNREQLVVARIDPEEATRAMALFEPAGMADVLFGEAVSHCEFVEVDADDMRAGKS